MSVMYYINFIEARYRSGKSNRGQPNSVKLLRQFLLPSAIALMIGACGGDAGDGSGVLRVGGRKGNCDSSRGR